MSKSTILEAVYLNKARKHFRRANRIVVEHRDAKWVLVTDGFVIIKLTKETAAEVLKSFTSLVGFVLENDKKSGATATFQFDNLTENSVAGVISSILPKPDKTFEEVEVTRVSYCFPTDRDDVRVRFVAAPEFSLIVDESFLQIFDLERVTVRARGPLEAFLIENGELFSGAIMPMKPEKSERFERLLNTVTELYKPAPKGRKEKAS